MFFDKGDASEEFLQSINLRILPKISNTNACETFDEYSDTLGAKEFGTLGTIKVGVFPADIKANLLALEVGAGLELFEEPEGFRSLILCDKIIPEITLPDFDSVLNDLTDTRVQLIAKRHLRDLRRDAIIDFR